jgi:hypothetical protein
MAGATLKGGEKASRYLASIATKLGGGGTVRVGFLEGATYPAAGRQGGKSAKAKRKAQRKQAAALYVATVAFWNEFGTSRTKPRPFFRGMIKRESPTWARKLAALAKVTGYDRRKMFALMGEDIKGALVQSVARWPADNAPSTVARKGFNKGLIDTGVMQRAPDYEVRT